MLLSVHHCKGFFFRNLPISKNILFPSLHWMQLPSLTWILHLEFFLTLHTIHKHLITFFLCLRAPCHGTFMGNLTDTGSRPPEMERICCCPSCL